MIAKLIDEGKEPPNWVDWSPVYVGNRVQVTIADVEGIAFPRAQVVMWGLSPKL
jgi:hypothetical protein